MSCERNTRVLFCWSRISGYMSACWRELSAQPGVDLRALAWNVSSTQEQAEFSESIAEGFDCRLLEPEERFDFNLLASEAKAFSPDIVVISGWHSPAYVRLVKQLRPVVKRVIMCIDTPWQQRAKQRLTRFRHASLLRRVDDVFVAGERSWQYARQLGFAEPNIHRGLYAWDESTFAPVAQAREASADWPRRFLYVGRYAEEKGIVNLLEAYQRYREKSADPWPLRCCGSGPLQHLVNAADGVEDKGFVQPADLPDMLRESGVFVLPSHYEPWGVALAEAMGAGLPAIATNACGAGIDLIRNGWNGHLIATSSSSALADAMIEMEDSVTQIAEMGRRASVAAEPFTSRNWAVRWAGLLT